MKKTPLTFKYRGTAGLSASSLKNGATALGTYRKRLLRTVDDGGYDTPEGALNLPTDKSVLDAVESASATLGDRASLAQVILIGIGGSSLGVSAIARALHQYNTRPTLHFLETISVESIAHVEHILEHTASPDELAVVIVSKSGGTLETITNAECVYALLKKKFGDESAKKRILVASNLDSPLMSAAEEYEFGTVPIPAMIGGRFSVLSGAGLLPLYLLGVDVEELLAGATWMRDTVLKEDGEKDAALQSAVFLHEAHKNHLSINSHFFFAPPLAGLGAWYRQIFAESLGKAQTLEGREVHFGMVPEIAIGSNDLHSVGQQFFGGPHIRATTFVSIPSAKASGTVPQEHDRLFPDIFPEISGAQTNELFSALIEGTKAAYKDADMPYTECLLDSISERSLGAFMMWKMIEVMYLAQLIGVNAFDQPEVERYKKHTQALFSS